MSMWIQRLYGYNIMLNVLEMDKAFKISRLEPKDGDFDQMVKDLEKGGSVAISSALAKKLGYKKGDTLMLNSPSGKVRLRIVAVLNDVAMEPGNIYMDRRDYKKYWEDDSVDGFAIKVAEGYSISDVSKQISNRWEEKLGIKVKENKEFRQEVLSMFDQQFALKNMIIYIAILVAAFGIMNTSLISILQRKRELSIIRALGAKRRQIRNLILNESLIMGFIGATFGGILGIGLGSAIVAGQGLIYDIPIKCLISWAAVAGGFIISLGLTAIGSVIPVRAALKTEIVDGIKYE